MCLTVYILFFYKKIKSECPVPGFFTGITGSRSGDVKVYEYNTRLTGKVDSLSFECQQCGECCSHLGLVHKIKEDRGDYRFLIYNQYTGEKTEVVVDPDKIPLFADKSTFSRYPEACPFFRYDALSAKGYCTIHQTRPEICREYGCWRMLILNLRGRRAGRIMYRRHLVSEDATLSRLFEQCIDTIKEPDDAAWDRRVIRILVRAGYTVRT